MRPATSRRRCACGEAQLGLRLLWADPRLRTLAALALLSALALSLAGTGYMIFVSRDIGFSPGVLGLVFATGGLGSLAGAAPAARIGEARGAGVTIAIGLALAAVEAVCTPPVAAASAVGIALLVAQQIVATPA